MNVFLSYSTKDKEIVDRARAVLANNGISVFDDKVDIAVGESLSSAVNAALDKADAIIFFISKNSSKSGWFNKELSFAVSNRFQGKEQRILPVVLDSEAEKPFFISDYKYLDLSNSKNTNFSFNQLIEILRKETTPIEPKKELLDKKVSIELERKIFELKKLEHEELKIHKSRQLFFVTLIATLFSITGASIGLLHGFANIELKEFDWLIYLLLGAASSMLGSFLYMKKEEPRKNEFLNKIKEVEDRVREMEVHHEQ